MQGSSGRGFLTRMGFRNIKTNRTMSIASVLVLVSCLMLIGLVFLAAANLGGIISQVSARNVIMVYLKGGMTPSEVAQLEQKIGSLSNVKDCSYVSSQEAFQRMKDRNQDSGYALLDDVDVSFMPSSFEVLPKNMDEFADTVTQLKLVDPAVTNVRDFQGVAEQLSAMEKALTIFGVAVIGVLLVVSVFIISSTVQATMYSRQQEIKVMKSVGAAPAFIRWPFLVEGIVLGVLGSLAALGVVFGLYAALGKALSPLLGQLLGSYALIPFGDYLKYLLPGFLCLGVLTGGGGSMLSITRYLKEKVYEKSELEA